MVSSEGGETRRALGQFFTPGDVAAFVLDAARVVLGRPARRLLDPACGEGVFLSTAVAKGVVPAEGAFGIEIDPALADASPSTSSEKPRPTSRRQRCKKRRGPESASDDAVGYLGFVPGVALRAQVARADALADPLPGFIEKARREGFDLVVGNPPFGGGNGKGRLELRFAERFALLAAPGGAGAVILPHGVFANATAAGVRGRLLDLIEPVAVVELPPDTFRRAGASARTCVLVFRKRRADDIVAQRGPGSERSCDEATCILVPWTGAAGADRGARFASVLAALRGGPLPESSRRVPVARLRGARWDPGFVREPPRTTVPLEPLGRFIRHITYGPIVTDRRGTHPADRPSDVDGGTRGARSGGRVRVVGLREIRPTGLDLTKSRRVRAGGPHDPPRCRLRPGDLVLARSGAGSLLKGRVAVFDGPTPATVGCFVDLVRLEGLDPGYALLCLRSGICREQVLSASSGVATPNLSFAQVRSLMIPRLAPEVEARLAREEAEARALHAAAVASGREPVEAARRLDSAVRALESAAGGRTSSHDVVGRAAGKRRDAPGEVLRVQAARAAPSGPEAQDRRDPP